MQEIEHKGEENRVSPAAEFTADSMSQGAMATHKYRTKLKADREKYLLHQKAERIRSQIRRDNKTSPQKERDAETAKIRMKRYREKKKAAAEKAAAEKAVFKDGVTSTSGHTPGPSHSTRAAKEKLKEYNRMKQRESRARRSAQKVGRTREKNFL